MSEIDQTNRAILTALQTEGGLPLRELAERVNLSPNACWHRVQTLKKQGIITGQTTRLDRRKLGLGLVVFVLLRTRHHSQDWLDSFRDHISAIPEIVDFYRIGGDYDYFLKVVTQDMETYDDVYQRMIAGIEYDSVTSYFAMEAIAEQRPLPIDLIGEKR